MYGFSRFTTTACEICWSMQCRVHLGWKPTARSLRGSPFLFSARLFPGAVLLKDPSS